MRKYIGTVLILIIAAGFAWWSAKTESSVSNHVQQEVAKLVPLFKNNPNVIESVVVDDVLQPTLADSLEQVWLKSSKSGGFRVLVTEGDDEQYGDGTATHVALFQIDTETVVGLRIICLSDTDPLLITGAWIK